MTETYNGYWSPVYGDVKKPVVKPKDPYHPVYPVEATQVGEVPVYQVKAVQAVSVK